MLAHPVELSVVVLYAIIKCELDAAHIVIGVVCCYALKLGIPRS